MVIQWRRFGELVGIKMPKDGPGKGLIFIKYQAVEHGTKAQANLHNRAFENRRVDATFYMPEEYENDSFK